MNKLITWLAKLPNWVLLFGTIALLVGLWRIPKLIPHRPPIEIIEINMVEDRILGKVKNVSSRDYDACFLTFGIYDYSDTQLDTAKARVRLLRAGKIANFDIILPYNYQTPNKLYLEEYNCY